MSENKAMSCTITMTNGLNWTFDAGERIVSNTGKDVELHEILDIMNDPDAWIVFRSETAFVEGESLPLEPWKKDALDFKDCLVKIYGRGVAAVTIIFEDGVLDESY